MMNRIIFLLIIKLQFALWTLSCFAEGSPEITKLIENARSQIGQTTLYDGSYQSLKYPGGDLPILRGVCTDVVIRAYRPLGIDLQKLVHEDMKVNFNLYPSKRIWGLAKPDANIDHRRVPNLQIFFQHFGLAFNPKVQGESFQPGDLLTWNLPGNLPHIGIASDRKNLTNSEYLILHNIGSGTQEEDIIGKFELTGHYRYRPWSHVKDN